MHAALAVVSIAVALAVGAVALFLLTRMFRTIVELRKVTVGLHDVLGWAAGNVLNESHARGSVAGKREPGRG
ncbi:MAG: hypothetical protein QOG94_1254 [Solirubrobacteraceae bacterium]|nr:hypothetical protein [Solirubrobacteraceae bacterium]MEA2139408.1 hypothetical protein [Solirubrobacteraceae bacterium]